jgi:hypothetical protein
VSDAKLIGRDVLSCHIPSACLRHRLKVNPIQIVAVTTYKPLCCASRARPSAYNLCLSCSIARLCTVSAAAAARDALVLRFEKRSAWCSNDRRRLRLQVLDLVVATAPWVVVEAFDAATALADETITELGLESSLVVIVDEALALEVATAWIIEVLEAFPVEVGDACATELEEACTVKTGEACTTEEEDGCTAEVEEA